MRINSSLASSNSVAESPSRGKLAIAKCGVASSRSDGALLRAHVRRRVHGAVDDPRKEEPRPLSPVSGRIAMMPPVPS
jgi:hypothetical protein